MDNNEKLLILANTLYERKHFPKNTKHIILYEHPQYFTKYNFNKKKLILHRASMKCYEDKLKKDYIVEYFEYNQELPDYRYVVYDNGDNLVLPRRVRIIEGPNFLLSRDKYKEFHNSRKTKKVLFNTFYKFVKEEIDILTKVSSTDKMNRSVPSKDHDFPKIKHFHKKEEKDYLQEAVDYINKHFPKNYGNSDLKSFYYPISSSSAKKHLGLFFKERFKYFGVYQDAIVKDEPHMYHSLLSSSLNIGLSNPLSVIKEAMKVKNVPINSREGFIRQLIWREYQRYCYIYYYNEYKTKNYFGNKKKLGIDYYKGTTEIPIINDIIVKAFDTRYLHHIERLMVIGNYMNLDDISPKEGLRWFMEFSCDSYEWVMYQNVLDMVFFVSGGLTTTRPYASSSNYIVKMSDYSCKEDESNWCDIWDKKYKDFIKKNKDKLYKFRYYFPGI